MTLYVCGLLQAEEQKRRAEADKLAAITALEQRSREFMLEKEEKRRERDRVREKSVRERENGEVVDECGS